MNIKYNIWSKTHINVAFLELIDTKFFVKNQNKFLYKMEAAQVLF